MPVLTLGKPSTETRAGPRQNIDYERHAAYSWQHAERQANLARDVAREVLEMNGEDAHSIIRLRCTEARCLLYITETYGFRINGQIKTPPVKVMWNRLMLGRTMPELSTVVKTVRPMLSPWELSELRELVQA